MEDELRNLIKKEQDWTPLRLPSPHMIRDLRLDSRD